MREEVGGTLSLLQQPDLDEADTPGSLNPLTALASVPLISQPNQLPLGLSFPKAHYILAPENWGMSLQCMNIPGSSHSQQVSGMQETSAH